MLYYETGSKDTSLTDAQLNQAIRDICDKLGAKKKILIIPPDGSRIHSQAGKITEMVWDYYGDAVTDILPALGTHVAMSQEEISLMFGKTPKELFRVHDWRNEITTLGTVPREFIEEVSEGKVSFDWPAQVAKLLVEGEFDLILSIGQVVPHEVIGMANYNKNIFVGTGGSEGINKSHFIGAVYGMERMMGRADTPVRRVLNYSSEHFASHLPIVYIQTVVSKDESDNLAIRGLYAGPDSECFEKAAGLSLQVNFQMVDKPLEKVVVYLDPHEYRSTWLGNKSIYRTRMALADGAELIILAPAVKEFGEDKTIDVLIRKYGYKGTDTTLAAVKENDDLASNLGAAAHLIHGSSEGRFSITYCPGHLTEKEITDVGFIYGDLNTMMKRYSVDKLKDGFNTLENGEEIFYISNPGLGLWAHESRFVD